MHSRCSPRLSRAPPPQGRSAPRAQHPALSTPRSAAPRSAPSTARYCGHPSEEVGEEETAEDARLDASPSQHGGPPAPRQAPPARSRRPGSPGRPPSHRGGGEIPGPVLHSSMPAVGPRAQQMPAVRRQHARQALSKWHTGARSHGGRADPDRGDPPGAGQRSRWVPGHLQGVQLLHPPHQGACAVQVVWSAHHGAGFWGRRLLGRIRGRPRQGVLQGAQRGGQRPDLPAGGRHQDGLQRQGHQDGHQEPAGQRHHRGGTQPLYQHQRPRAAQGDEALHKETPARDHEDLHQQLVRQGTIRVLDPGRRQVKGWSKPTESTN
ncbi:hypothetical protein FOCC_FOCC008617 [Frankliniella occidentalis]|nr:hypothetical protein FOCC_FOCC008617 [Frankliniella occidentalis]